MHDFFRVGDSYFPRIVFLLLLLPMVMGCSSPIEEVEDPPVEATQPPQNGDARLLAHERIRQSQVESVRRQDLMNDVATRDLASESPSESLWKGFRKAFSFHTQTIALSKKSRDGSRTLIISEPPPQVSLGHILLAASDVLRSHEVKAHPIGYDGWVKDVILSVKGSDEQIAATISKLNRLLFYTSYKAYTLPLPARRSTKTYDLDLKVSAAEIENWLLSDKDVRFIPAGGGSEIVPSDIFRLTESGVFTAANNAFVGWWIPSGSAVGTCAIQVRQFALDSDLIIGAISQATGVLILGRSRIVPVDILPPLRFETVKLLAAAQSGPDSELGQSYERGYPFSGFINNHQDWAPIFLSQALVDTEYGSLLNITDQLLKGWSNGGHTEYVNFDYPRPQKYPFNFLPDELGGESLVYNWNTKGAAYRINTADRSIFALNRTGALPVSYFPDQEESGEKNSVDAVLKAEDTAYDYFGQQNDPNLVRVVQYASLYQVFSSFTSPGESTTLERSRFPVLDKMLEDLFNEIILAEDEDLRKLSREIAEQLDFDFGGSPISFEDRVFARLKLLKNNGVRASRGSLDGMVLSGLAAARRIPERYASAVAKSSEGWIHTPVVVISSTVGPNSSGTGGHNLSAKIEQFRMSDGVPSGTVRVSPDGSFIVNPVDAPRALKLVRTAARFGNETPDALSARLSRGLARIKPVSTLRPAADALRIPLQTPNPPVGLTPITQFADLGPSTHRAVGWGRHNKPISSIARETPEVPISDTSVILERRNGMFYINRAREGSSIQAFTMEDATDAMVYLLHRDAAAGGSPLHLELRGFAPDEATVFMKSYKARALEENLPREVSALVRDSKMNTNELVALRDKALDFRKAKVTTSEITETNTGLRTSIKVEIPSRVAGEKAARSTIDLEFSKETPRGVIGIITSRVMAAIRRIVAEVGTTVDSIRFNLRLNAEIKKISIETGVDFHIVEQKFDAEIGKLYFAELEASPDLSIGSDYEDRAQASLSE